MADNQENQASQPDELRRPDDESAGDERQREEPEDGSKVEAGEPKRGEKPNSSRPKKTDSFTWITAAISAIAALAGTLIGALISYHTVQSQANARVSAAQSSAIVKGNADRINKRERQKDYADYLKNERSLVNTEALLVTILRSNPGDLVALNRTKDKWNKDSLTAARSDFILSFNDSDGADNIREEISHQTDAIHNALAKLIDQASAHEPMDQPGLRDLDTMFAALQSQFDRFADQAKADLRSPNGGLRS
jgi:hypothetical protein